MKTKGLIYQFSNPELESSKQSNAMQCSWYNVARIAIIYGQLMISFSLIGRVMKKMQRLVHCDAAEPYIQLVGVSM